MGDEVEVSLGGSNVLKFFGNFLVEIFSGCLVVGIFFLGRVWIGDEGFGRYLRR